jgi:hypothetical protein
VNKIKEQVESAISTGRRAFIVRGIIEDSGVTLLVLLAGKQLNDDRQRAYEAPIVVPTERTHKVLRER